MIPEKWKEEPEWKALNRTRPDFQYGRFFLVNALLIETALGYSMVLQGSHGLVIEPLPQLENE